MLSKLTSTTFFVDYHFNWPTITSTELASAALLMFFVILSALECYSPKVKRPAARLRQSYRTNAKIFIFNSIVFSLLSMSSLLLLAEQYSPDRDFPDYLEHPAARALLSFLVLDLMFYLWHRASHRFDSLWMFHKVHHNDPYINVSTAFRIHTVELLIATVLKAAYIIMLEVDRTTLLLQEAVMMLFVMFHHTNIAFPGEKLLSRVFVTPYLHRAHHSALRVEHDNNYGAVLSIWDRLFGTLVELEPAIIGIKGNGPQTFAELLKFGFTPEAAPAYVAPAPVVSTERMIAEAAYFKAEKRGFNPGYELCDWLEAEREIISRIYQTKTARSRSRQETFGFLKWGFKNHMTA